MSWAFLTLESGEGRGEQNVTENDVIPGWVPKTANNWKHGTKVLSVGSPISPDGTHHGIGCYGDGMGCRAGRGL